MKDVHERWCANACDRHAQDVRQHYQHKLQRANNLYMELTACLFQLEKREHQLIRSTVQSCPLTYDLLTFTRTEG